MSAAESEERPSRSLVELKHEFLSVNVLERKNTSSHDSLRCRIRGASKSFSGRSETRDMRS